MRVVRQLEKQKRKKTTMTKKLGKLRKPFQNLLSGQTLHIVDGKVVDEILLSFLLVNGPIVTCKNIIKVGLIRCCEIIAVTGIE